MCKLLFGNLANFINHTPENTPNMIHWLQTVMHCPISLVLRDHCNSCHSDVSQNGWPPYLQLQHTCSLLCCGVGGWFSLSLWSISLLTPALIIPSHTHTCTNRPQWISWIMQMSSAGLTKAKQRRLRLATPQRSTLSACYCSCDSSKMSTWKRI